MDFETTFFSQLKKPCHILGFWNFAFCVAISGKTPVQSLVTGNFVSHAIHFLLALHILNRGNSCFLVYVGLLVF